jgi:hypothetical protein
LHGCGRQTVFDAGHAYVLRDRATERRAKLLQYAADVCQWDCESLKPARPLTVFCEWIGRLKISLCQNRFQIAKSVWSGHGRPDLLNDPSISPLIMWMLVNTVNWIYMVIIW